MKVKKFNGRSHWGKSGLVYHSSEMLELKLDTQARTNFVGKMKEFQNIVVETFSHKKKKKFQPQWRNTIQTKFS